MKYNKVPFYLTALITLAMGCSGIRTLDNFKILNNDKIEDNKIEDNKMEDKKYIWDKNDNIIYITEVADNIFKEYTWVSTQDHSEKKLREKAMRLFCYLHEQGTYSIVGLENIRGYLDKLDASDGLKNGCISWEGIKEMSEESLEKRF